MAKQVYDGDQSMCIDEVMWVCLNDDEWQM